MRLLAGRESKPALGNGHLRVRRNDVDVVRFHGHAILHLNHWHLGFPGKNLRQQAFVFGVQMLNQHKSHAAITL